MADELGCELLHVKATQAVISRTYKFLIWGSVSNVWVTYIVGDRERWSCAKDTTYDHSPKEGVAAQNIQIRCLSRKRHAWRSDFCEIDMRVLYGSLKRASGRVAALKKEWDWLGAYYTSPRGYTVREANVRVWSMVFSCNRYWNVSSVPCYHISYSGVLSYQR